MVTDFFAGNPSRQQGTAVPSAWTLNSGRRGTSCPLAAFRRLGPRLQDPRQRRAGRHWPRNGLRSEGAKERVYRTPSAWDQIATIFSNPVVMTALCMLQEKVLINSGKAKSSDGRPFLSAFPAHSYVLKENRTFPLPLCLRHRHRLSFLLCGFLMRKDARCLLPSRSAPCHPCSTVLLLQEPASLFC